MTKFVIHCEELSLYRFFHLQLHVDPNFPNASAVKKNVSSQNKEVLQRNIVDIVIVYVLRHIRIVAAFANTTKLM